MPGDHCIVCGNTRRKDKSISLHRLPKDPARRRRWIVNLGLDEESLKDFHWVCSRHFPNANPKNDPQLTVGKRFASPVKQWMPRAKRVVKRDEIRELSVLSSSSAHSGRSHSPTPTPVVPMLSPSPEKEEPMRTEIGEQLDCDYGVHELPGLAIGDELVKKIASTNNAEVVVNAALIARIDVLESEIRSLRDGVQKERKGFRLDDIAGNDKLVKLYTNFPT